MLFMLPSIVEELFIYSLDLLSYISENTGTLVTVSWCWGFLGKNVCVPLPSCAVAKIQARYPDNKDLNGLKFELYL